MANYAIITDLNRCTGCLACTVACKAINGVDVGNFWIKTLRIGPHPIEGGSGEWDFDVPMQPSFVDFPKADGTSVPALVFGTKAGQIYVLDRATGQRTHETYALADLAIRHRAVIAQCLQSLIIVDPRRRDAAAELVAQIDRLETARRNIDAMTDAVNNANQGELF